MRAITSLRSGALPHSALNASALQELASHDLAAAIALGMREARRLRAEATWRLFHRAWTAVKAWPRARIHGALRFNH